MPPSIVQETPSAGVDRAVSQTGRISSTLRPKTDTHSGSAPGAGPRNSSPAWPRNIFVIVAGAICPRLSINTSRGHYEAAEGRDP